MCFDKYVAELVSHAWGLSSLHVKCPVCAIEISYSEWKNYVNKETIEKYEKFNRPFPVFSRFCVHCDEENLAVCQPDLNKQITIEDFDSIYDKMQLCGYFDDAFMKAFKSEYKRYVYEGIGSMENIYHTFISAYSQFESNYNNPDSPQLPSLTEDSGEGSSTAPRKRRRTRSSLGPRYNVSQISSELVALEKSPELWKELQFLHLSTFPQTKCKKCERAICFKCGESTWHKGIACELYLKKRIIQAKGSSGTLATLKWKLAHSRPCPNCHIFINRDEGCNKIDCSHCGFQFCWVCCKKWSEDCGFYRCSGSDAASFMTDSKAASTGEKTPKFTVEDESRPESGVPDVAAILSRLKANFK
ncbi:hypothetical protein ROZALSC1DRAFT_27373 [Rozella allomycis CSF55]|uniref:RBR-type E3 ubiquitin transferase n=1 Tax=Rozella allomycis (strain CSF55) TaxID=988480 RepID=A0A4P9YNB2_ROZAC|nr:hypothetical protein ROZALSC1DRAFT_27373 [Rozella allomycis CSF55]